MIEYLLEQPDRDIFPLVGVGDGHDETIPLHVRVLLPVIRSRESTSPHSTHEVTVTNRAKPPLAHARATQSVLMNTCMSPYSSSGQIKECQIGRDMNQRSGLFTCSPRHESVGMNIPEIRAERVDEKRGQIAVPVLVQLALEGK